MRVLILANNDVGLFRFREELICEILKNHEVSIALPYGALVEPLKSVGCRFFDTEMDRRGINPVADFKLIKQYSSLLKKIKPDLVIAYTIKPNIYGGIVCRLRRTAYAANITGLGTAFEKGGMLKLLVTALYRFALRKAKVVFFENEDNKDLIVNKRIVQTKQAKLLHGAGVDLEKFGYQPYPKNDVFRFLFIGRIMKEKGINELFIATRQLIGIGKACRLDVVGPIEENFKEELEKYGAEGWLKYHGYQKDVRPYIADCDCFVLPSYHEGMANTNLECASSGRPIITSDIPGCKEAVTEGSGLLCKPKDPESLYNAMMQMIELSRKDREEMGRAARRHMEDVFDKHIVVAETMRELFK